MPYKIWYRIDAPAGITSYAIQPLWDGYTSLEGALETLNAVIPWTGVQSATLVEYQGRFDQLRAAQGLYSTIAQRTFQKKVE